MLPTCHPKIIVSQDLQSRSSYVSKVECKNVQKPQQVMHKTTQSDSIVMHRRLQFQRSSCKIIKNQLLFLDSKQNKKNCPPSQSSNNFFVTSLGRIPKLKIPFNRRLSTPSTQHTHIHTHRHARPHSCTHNTTHLFLTFR